jgi:hypothetical protein
MVNSKTILLSALGLMGTPVYALNFGFPQFFHKLGLIWPGTSFYATFLYQFSTLGALYLAGLGIAFRRDTEPATGRCLLYIVLFFGILYRVLLVPTQPMLSSDMYRYIWDGRVQAHGINPYRYPPNHKAIEHLRDKAVYPYINRKGSPTIYPAGTQLLFYALNKLGIRSVSAFKGAVCLFDTGSMLLLVMILTNLGLNRERVLIYAWNPLVIYELGNNGHLDGFMVFFILLALLFLIKGRSVASVSSLAFAASLKLYPAVILPAIIRNKKIQGLAVFTCIILLLYLPYLSAGKKIVGFLPEYFENPYERFNLGLKAYILSLFPDLDHLIITKLFAVALIVVAGIVFIKQKNTIRAIKFACVLAGLQIVLSSASFHPWYVVWIIPFLAMFPSPAWIFFSLVLPFSYLKYGSPSGNLPEWIRHLEYIPFFILLALDYFMSYRSSYRPLTKRRL